VGPAIALVLAPVLAPVLAGVLAGVLALALKSGLRAAALPWIGGKCLRRRQMQLHAALARQAGAVQRLVQVPKIGLQQTQRFRPFDRHADAGRSRAIARDLDLQVPKFRRMKPQGQPAAAVRGCV
jgi:hypothetical protein